MASSPAGCPRFGWCHRRGGAGIRRRVALQRCTRPAPRPTRGKSGCGGRAGPSWTKCRQCVADLGVNAPRIAAARVRHQGLKCFAARPSRPGSRAGGARRPSRNAGGPDHVAGLEHEGHRAADVVRFRGVDGAGLLERGRIGPVPGHAVVQRAAARVKPSALASYSPCTRPMNSRWRCCGGTTAGGRCPAPPAPAAGRSRNPCCPRRRSLGEVSTRRSTDPGGRS